MRLNIYLLRENIDELESATRYAYIRGDKARAIQAETVLPYKAVAYVFQARETKPRWATFLASHFTLDCFHAQAGFLLLLEAADRKFAVTFGAGYHLLDPGAIEPNFGMRVCANALNPKKVKSVDARNIDTLTRQARININAGSELGGFDLDARRNWMRSLSGAPVNPTMGATLSGADSLKVSRDVRLEDLHSLCVQLLEEHEKETHKERFPDLGYLSPLRRQDPLVTRLNVLLEKRVRSGDSAKLSMALPYVPEDEVGHRFRFFHAGAEREYSGLSLEHVRAHLRAFPRVVDALNHVRVIALDDNGEPISHAFKLRDYLVAELVHEKELYLCTAGHWFRIEQDFARATRERIAQIADLAEELELPEMGLEEDEKDYNDRVAKAKGWKHFDRKLFHGTGSERWQKIEVCDLLAPGNRFICVKKMTASACLSHLFAQGAVSMDLLKHEARYRKEALEQAGELAHEGFRDPRPTVVFAIATEKAGSLAEALFLFSAIHLVQQLRAIAGADADVALVPIPMVASEEVAGGRTRKRPTPPAPEAHDAHSR